MARGTGHAYQSVVSNIGFDSGTQFWTIAIDVYGTERDVFIGVIRAEPSQIGLFNYSRHLIETGVCWGWTCTDAKKFAPTTSDYQPYGDYSKIGEQLKALLQFNSKGDSASLTFIRNGKSLGTAFESIPLMPG